MFLIRKARKLARKWGGTCMVFIDEIDAVGLRRQALGAAGQHERLRAAAPGARGAPDVRAVGRAEPLAATSCSRRGRGATASSAARADPPAAVCPPASSTPSRDRIQRRHDPRRNGRHGRRAGAQPAARADGRRRRAARSCASSSTNRVNTFLDATYVVPRSIGTPAPAGASPPKPRPEQVYFIGATNVPARRARPGARAPGPHGPPHLVPHADEGRPRRTSSTSTWPRSPTTPELDRPERRDELARMTNGYSPAMIEQVCSMAPDLRALRGPRRVRPRATSSRR